ncbi:uncharacterized protein LOC133532897 [Cydia pomonella]|uniref:uncharacterized protein LOC133532897 n=1 Tax=Cydia pomonella TaxID=82600 RepID=UPI002ADDC977|nr:uncharacterized protein LOC133532897 [Cydia pomonella]
MQWYVCSPTSSCSIDTWIVVELSETDFSSPFRFTMASMSVTKRTGSSSDDGRLGVGARALRRQQRRRCQERQDDFHRSNNRSSESEARESPMQAPWALVAQAANSTANVSIVDASREHNQ